MSKDKVLETIKQNFDAETNNILPEICIKLQFSPDQFFSEGEVAQFV